VGSRQEARGVKSGIPLAAGLAAAPVRPRAILSQQAHSQHLSEKHNIPHRANQSIVSAAWLLSEGEQRRAAKRALIWEIAPA
jgi:hypothetical protein